MEKLVLMLAGAACAALWSGIAAAETVNYYDPVEGKLVIPESIDGKTVSEIGDFAFDAYSSHMECVGLQSVILPPTLRKIGEYAFRQCTGITTMTIPASVTQIGCYAFCKDTVSESLHFEGNAPEILAGGQEATLGLTSTCMIHVKPGTTGWTNPWQDCPVVVDGAQ